MKILIIEDELDLSRSIVQYLTKNDFLCDEAHDFSEADLKINLYQYDCILVDIGLPDGNGLQIIQNLKKRKSKSGIIIITAKDSLDDKVNGLSIGADDYLSKPFHLAELNARIRAVIRRRFAEGNTIIECNNLSLDIENRYVCIDGKDVNLTRKEFDLLLYLITNKNQVLTKEAIAEHLWGSNIDLVDSFEFIYSHVKNLRKKMVDGGFRDCIRTVYGVGYRFSVE
jgi:DNA-binding response OmpR family regulator